MAGIALPEGYDTLDLSGTGSDTSIDIYDLATLGGDEKSVLWDVLNISNDEGESLLGLGGNVILVKDESLKDYFESFGFGSYDFNETWTEAQGNYIFATDIENLVLGSGETTVKFIGAGSLQGTITPSGGGKLVLDYSEYTGSAKIDPDAGVNYELIPPIEIMPSFTLGDLTIAPITWGGLKWNYGSATGIDGNRLMGLDQYISLVTGYKPENFALTDYSNAVGSAGDDNFKGTGADNIFILGTGGTDTIVGGDGANSTVQWSGVKAASDEKHGDVVVFGSDTGGIGVFCRCTG